MIDASLVDYCQHCGQPFETEKPAERLGLRIDGHHLSYGGKRLSLRPAHAKFVRLLIERGKAHKELMILRVCPDATSNLIQVYANAVRAILNCLTNGAVKLRTIHSWGYELIVVDAERLAA